MPNSSGNALVFPAAAPVVPILWAHFGDEKRVKDVPELVEAGKVGGWLTIENSIRPFSYHNDLQRITIPLAPPGRIYTTGVEIGSATTPLPPIIFEQMLQVTRKPLASTLVSADCVFFAMGGRYTELDANNEKTCVNSIARNSRYLVIIAAYWKESAGDKGRADAKAWAHAVKAVVQSQITKAPLRYEAKNAEETAAEEEKSGYDDPLEAKFHALKAKYDLNNVFITGAHH